MQKIDGGKNFDLLEDGEFFATSANFELGGENIVFFGTWNRTGDPDEKGVPATLDILTSDPVTEENYLTVGWDESHVAAD